MVGSIAVTMLATASFFSASVVGFGYGGGHGSGGEGSGTACIVKVGPEWLCQPFCLFLGLLLCLPLLQV